MNHHGPSIGHGLGLDPPNKSQQARGVIGHAVVRPAREVKLPYLPDLVSPSLRSRVIVLNTHAAAAAAAARRLRIQIDCSVRDPSKTNTRLD